MAKDPGNLQFGYSATSEFRRHGVSDRVRHHVGAETGALAQQAPGPIELQDRLTAVMHERARRRGDDVGRQRFDHRHHRSPLLGLLAAFRIQVDQAVGYIAPEAAQLEHRPGPRQGGDEQEQEHPHVKRFGSIPQRPKLLDGEASLSRLSFRQRQERWDAVEFTMTPTPHDRGFGRPEDRLDRSRRIASGS